MITMNLHEGYDSKRVVGAKKTLLFALSQSREGFEQLIQTTFGDQYNIELAATTEAAFRAAQQYSLAIVVADSWGTVDGIELLIKLRQYAGCAHNKGAPYILLASLSPDPQWLQRVNYNALWEFRAQSISPTSSAEEIARKIAELLGEKAQPELKTAAVVSPPKQSDEARIQDIVAALQKEH